MRTYYNPTKYLFYALIFCIGFIVKDYGHYLLQTTSLITGLSLLTIILIVSMVKMRIREIRKEYRIENDELDHQVMMQSSDLHNLSEKYNRLKKDYNAIKRSKK